MLRVVCMALMNVIPVVATIFGAAYAVQPAYGIGFSKDVYLWIPVLGNILAVLVIPFVGNLSDKIGRKPPIIVGALAAGLARVRLSLRDQHQERAAGDRHVAPDVGRGLPGLQRHFPELLPGAVPDAHAGLGDGDRAEHRDDDHGPASGAVRYWWRRPARPMFRSTIGAIAFGITVIAALAALSARETYRVHLNDLGTSRRRSGEPEGLRPLRAQSLAGAAGDRVLRGRSPS